jgi:hypothetical protein
MGSSECNGEPASMIRISIGYGGSLLFLELPSPWGNDASPAGHSTPPRVKSSNSFAYRKISTTCTW